MAKRPNSPRRHERYSKHDDDRRHHEQRLPFDKMKTVEPDALGNGGASREGQQNSKAHQGQTGCQEKTIDCPPPVGYGTTVNTTNH